MTVAISILGLDRLGGSLALRLAKREDLRIAGYDRDPSVAKRAQSQGALHKAHWNLFNAIEGADVVVVALPFAEQRETLKLIAPDLRPGSVVVAAGSLLVPPLAWAAELLGETGERHLVAAHPVLNPSQLHTGDFGFEAARADLFGKGLWALAPAPNCAPEGLRLAADLARLVDAFPYFVDPHEHDGLAAAADNLPALLAWALMRAAAVSPGWPETRKVADRSFATATAALVDMEPAVIRANRENVLRYLDAALADLQTLRQWLARDDGPSLEAALTEAAELRAAWVAVRAKGDWEHLDDVQTDMPTAGDMLGRMLVGGLMGKRGEKKDADR